MRQTEKQAFTKWGIIWGVGLLNYIYRTAKDAGIIDLISTAWIERNPILFIAIGCILTSIIGWSLHVFKRKNQFLYGFTEIILSLVVSANVVYNNIDHEIKLAASELIGAIVPFLTAIYFTQRGFNNLFDGIEKAKKEEKETEKINALIDLKLKETNDIS